MGCAALLTASACGTFAAKAAEPPKIVINEIFYNPPNDRDDLQFVEVFNPGKEVVDISNWAFTKGIHYKFPAATRLEASGYLVVCRNQKSFGALYGPQARLAPGEFTGKLSHGTERLELSDAQGKLVDGVKYSDKGEWPAGPDGYASSMERICAVVEGDRPDNWTSSAPQPRLFGTPGRQNDGFSTNLPPTITQVEVSPRNPKPSDPVTVRAHVADSDGVQEVNLVVAAAVAGVLEPERTIPMKQVATGPKGATFEAVIDPQPQGKLVRLKVQASDKLGTIRLVPGENEPRPGFSYYVNGTTNTGTIPTATVLQFAAPPRPGTKAAAKQRPTRPNSASGVGERGNSAFVYQEVGSAEVQLFDYIRVTPRKGGIKVRLHKDHPLNEMTSVNIISEGSPRWLLSEHLAYELYGRSKVMTEKSGHVRLSMNDRPRGYFLYFEQPNKSFLRRHQRDDSGNLYKLLWFGNGVVGQHEKKSNPMTGHADLLEVLDGLAKTSGQKQWEYIEKNFNVEAMIDYFVVNMCIQNWDGFFNNYFAYHDLRKGGKWEMIPWDEDKTWGDYDGASPDYDWYTMPLGYGMNTRGQATTVEGGFGGIGGFFNVSGWERPPGYFSGPLLANPEFRKRFLARLEEFCNTVFTPEKFGPVITELQRKLGPEVKYAAELRGQDPGPHIQRFVRNIRSFQQQLENRRKFILAEVKRAR